MNKQRPLSPHLSIYKPQITSMLSILHRITGFYLFLGMLVLVWCIIGDVYFTDKKVACLSFFISNIIGKLLLLSWGFSLFYHLCNGIRHLVWDVGKGYDLKTVNISGMLVVFSSILLTLICMLIVLKHQGM